MERRDRWLNPPERVKWMEEPVPGYPKRPVARDEAAAKELTVERDTVFSDRNLTGFGVPVYPSGGKVYIVQARERTGKKLPMRVTIGRHDVLNAEESRRRAALIIARIRAGEEPLPLPPMAVELLEALPRRKGSPWVFPGNDRHRHYSGGGLDHV